jgi:hypothetical protein
VIADRLKRVDLMTPSPTQKSTLVYEHARQMEMN